MTEDLDTLLIASYVVVDDHVVEAVEPRRRPGRPKKPSDVELVCLAVAQVLLGARSEHHWLRMRYGRLGHLFLIAPGARPLRYEPFPTLLRTKSRSSDVTASAG
ncbi:hypothetical protein [Nonomuraea dietziae]|uniref:hypothetical protein n=1 Tax=Nonomuraea dietziae TaxID=65515 RepID=UPI0033F8B76C